VASIETGSGREEETGFMPTGYRPSAPRSNPSCRISASSGRRLNHHSVHELPGRKLVPCLFFIDI
jgi:hypothetical protein